MNNIIVKIDFENCADIGFPIGSESIGKVIDVNNYDDLCKLENESMISHERIVDEPIILADSFDQTEEVSLINTRYIFNL